MHKLNTAQCYMLPPLTLQASAMTLMFESNLKRSVKLLHL